MKYRIKPDNFFIYESRPEYLAYYLLKDTHLCHLMDLRRRSYEIYLSPPKCRWVAARLLGSESVPLQACLLYRAVGVRVDECEGLAECIRILDNSPV